MSSAPALGAPVDTAMGVEVVVPHLVGHHIDVALRMVHEVGLRARVVTTEVHDKTDRHVVSTHPPAGRTLRTGHEVEVVIGIAPVVGDYTGRDLDDAVRLAELNGHLVEVLVHRDGGPTGTCTHQDPEPGVRQRVVTLHVSTGTDTNRSGTTSRGPRS